MIEVTRKRVSKALLLSAAVGLTVGVGSTGAQAMSLQEAVQLVVTTNPVVGEQVKNRRSIDHELRQARGLYLPQIDAQFNIGPEFSENGSVDRPDPVLDQGPHDNGRWLVRRDAQVSLQQRIFDGGFTDSEVERQISRIKSQAERIQDEAQVESLEAVRVYLDVLRHQERVTNAEANVRAHEEILGLVQSRAELGGGNIADVRQAEARLATARSSLIQIQGDLRNSQAEFVRIVGQPASELQPVMAGPDMPIPADVEQSVARGLQMNPKIRLEKHDIDVAQSELDKEDSVFWPQVNLEVTGNANRWNNGVEEQTYNASAQVFVRYNLYRGGADIARSKEFKEHINEQLEQLRQREREVEEDVRTSWADRQTQQESVENLTKQVDANQQTKDVYQQQFDIGQRGLLDLLDAANDLFNSQDDLITARSQEIFTNYRILAAQGEMVQYVGAVMPVEATPDEVTYAE
ncbi:adhesin transport system outer membrane protein [Dongia mobilis]|uniref:Adhesin transport system outer membrane protein n=1 Tax=Dongia mobilis TaxID=578943 RepID=A0A4R6WKW7_9PROT|nr:TolC family outer membrane protein [Dongia mobilis]TDQ81315.1 adhesin transport system outer membrane protein [Dongia mobilis]